MFNSVRIISIVASIIFSLEIVNAQWISEYSPVSTNLNSIQLINEESGWIVGNEGTILYLDKGKWIEVKKITTEDLYSIFLLDNNTAWAVGSNGKILHFNGISWEEFPSPTKSKLYSVSFNDSGRGIAVGENGTVIVYEQGNWQLIPYPGRGALFSVSSKENLTLLGGGRESMSIPVMSMSNEAVFTKSFDPDYIIIKSISILDQRHIWAVGMPGVIYFSNGRNWERETQFNKLPSLTSISFPTENNGVAVGYSGTILKYSSNVWTLDESPVNEKLNGVAGKNNLYYAVGNNGTILSFKQKKEVEVSIDENQNGGKILSYPNPANEYINIVIPDPVLYSGGIITIINPFGQVVLSKRLNGEQTFRIVTEDFGEGLYMVNIKSHGGISASGKFIVGN